MKPRRTPLLLKIFNIYHVGLLLYLMMRAMFSGAWWWLGLLNTFALWLFMPLLLMIPLALLLQGKRTAAVSLFLAIIGFRKFAPMAEEHPNGDKHDIRILAFNIWRENQHIGKTVEWIRQQGADVIILEEFVGSHWNELPRLLEIYPFHAYIEDSVIIFSRYPFVESEILRIEETSHDYRGRLALRTVLDIGGQLVSIYGVHFDTPRREDFRFGLETTMWPLSFILRYDETHRNRQIRNLARIIAQDNNAVILAGDFNTSHTSTILNEFSAIGLVDSYTRVGGDWGMTWPHADKLRPMLRIDHIWASQTLRPLRFKAGQFAGSDHLPLVADFAFSERR